MLRMRGEGKDFVEENLLGPGESISYFIVGVVIVCSSVGQGSLSHLQRREIQVCGEEQMLGMRGEEKDFVEEDLPGPGELYS